MRCKERKRRWPDIGRCGAVPELVGIERNLVRQCPAHRQSGTREHAVRARRSGRLARTVVVVEGILLEYLRREVGVLALEPDWVVIVRQGLPGRELWKGDEEASL